MSKLGEYLEVDQNVIEATLDKYIKDVELDKDEFGLYTNLY